jgi:Protein of unknown function (DUF1572).
MSESIIANFHADAVQSFRNYKKMAERAMEQVSDEEFFAAIDEKQTRSRSSSNISREISFRAGRTF